MSCGFKDESGKVCGVKTSINPKTKEHYEYCSKCFIQMRKNRQNRFIEASRKAIGKQECLWVGNYNSKTPFRVKCIESPIYNGWCSIHKETVESDEHEPKKSAKNREDVDKKLSEFMTDIPAKKDKKGKLKALAENPELSEDDNIMVVSNKSKKVRETKPKPVEKTDKSKKPKLEVQSDSEDADDTDTSKKQKTKKSKKDDDNSEQDQEVVVEKEVKIKKSSKSDKSKK